MVLLYKLKRLRDIAGANCKLFVSLMYVRTHKGLYKESIWLITEKRDEARDNGYWLFKHIKEEHPETNACFVISSTAPDAKKVAQWRDSIIEPDSFRHCVLFLAAENNISSQNDGAHPFWHILRRKDLLRWKRLANPKQKVIFLQHGVTKDEIPHEAFDYGKNPMDCFVAAAEREQQFIIEKYNYPPKCVPNLGFCRFDNLYDHSRESERVVLVMPTWRKWLQPRQGDHKNEETKRFKNSEYFNAYNRLLASKELESMLKENGYELLFYPHYEMQKYLSAFSGIRNSMVSICSKDDFEVQELLLRAKILITDYSSVFFDFAYMNKPIVYYHFDYEQFTNTHFCQGYFDYKRDGFGPVCGDEHQVMKALKELFDHNCANPSLYHTRADDFFNRSDGLNCQRNFEYIKSFTRQG